MYQNYFCQKLTHLQSFSISKIFVTNIFRLNIPKNLQKCSSFVPHNSSLALNKQINKKLLKRVSNPACRRLKTTKTGDENKNQIAIRYEQPLTKLKIWGATTEVVTHFTPRILGSISMTYDIIKKDLVLKQRYIKGRLIKHILASKDMSLGEIFQEIAFSNSTDVMIYFEDTRWTYKQVEILANKITNYFLSLKYEKGDVVTILVTNRPEYITLILGLSKIGIIPALININFTESKLLHAIQVADCKGLIVSEDLLPEFIKIKDKIDSKTTVFQLDGILATKNFVNLADALIVSPDRTPEVVFKINQRDPLFYVYTSNLLNFPKAAMLSHSKFIANSLGITYLLNLGKNDIIYDPLPLYQTTGLVVGLGPSIVCGIPVVIRRKFSANKYLLDCKKYKCTVGQCVGEFLKYLILQPKSTNDHNHTVKTIISSGLDQDLWKELVQRFHVEIAQLYDVADENYEIFTANGIKIEKPSFTNPVTPARMEINDLKLLEKKYRPNYAKLGTSDIIFRPEISRHSRVDITIARHAEMTEKTIQNMIKSGSKKIENNLTNNKLVYVDRLEETHCWREECTNTAEIESVINNLININNPQCAVYTVQIPNIPRKFGMAIISRLPTTINLRTFSNSMKKYLPQSACPVFIRLVEDPNIPASAIRIKDNIKLYADEGFDPTKIKDKLYYINLQTQFYEPLTENIYKKIIAKEVIF